MNEQMGCGLVGPSSSDLEVGGSAYAICCGARRFVGARIRPPLLKFKRRALALSCRSSQSSHFPVRGCFCGAQHKQDLYAKYTSLKLENEDAS
jgi:hypothetical protein